MANIILANNYWSLAIMKTFCRLRTIIPANISWRYQWKTSILYISCTFIFTKLSAKLFKYIHLTKRRFWWLAKARIVSDKLYHMGMKLSLYPWRTFEKVQDDTCIEYLEKLRVTSYWHVWAYPNDNWIHHICQMNFLQHGYSIL